MGVSATGAGVPTVWSYGDDAEAGRSGQVYLLVFGVSALGGGGEMKIVSDGIGRHTPGAKAPFFMLI
jgi:hypothetical protein